jgi:hypothetical protein
MSVYKNFETSAEKEINGVEVVLTEAENEDGTCPTFVLCRMGKSNKRYSKALEAGTRPYRRQIELGTMPNEKAEEIFLNVFVETILKDWRNVKDKNGNDLALTKENAKTLFKDLPDLYDRLQEEAKVAASFRAESLEEEAKN